MSNSKSILSIAILFFLLFSSPLGSATPGGLESGSKFTLTVSQKSSIRISQFSTDTNAPVFSGAPNFANGQKVVFRIGKNGKIMAKDMSIPIVRSDSLSNIYMKQRKVNSVLFVSNGQLVKSNKIPDSIVLTFARTSGSGFQTTAHTVSYVLE